MGFTATTIHPDAPMKARTIRYTGNALTFQEVANERAALISPPDPYRTRRFVSASMSATPSLDGCFMVVTRENSDGYFDDALFRLHYHAEKEKYSAELV